MANDSPSLSLRQDLFIRTHGALLVLGTIFVLELCRRAGISVPNPQLFTALAITYAAYSGGYMGGLAGAAIGVGYAFYFFSAPGELFHYTEITRAKVIVNIITLPSIAILVSHLSDKLTKNLRAQAEQALSESEARFRGAFENAGVGVFIRSPDRKYREFNRTFCEMLGYSEDEIKAMRLRDIAHPDDDPEIASIRSIPPGSGENHVIERRFIRKDGKVIWCNVSYKEVLDAEGRPSTTIAMCQDITERKEMERRLQQSQKMEAVGQLTGGVAHDFNNLLSVIMGAAELLAEKTDAKNPHLESILRSTRRGAELTRRLLAFSRCQPLHPQAIDLPTMVTGLRHMLGRTLGETVDIATVSAPDVWPAAADPGQLENALVNLCINARDAMPGGGTVTIECTNATVVPRDTADDGEILPGDYAVLTVTDCGTGMSEDVLEHVFEPFFTTKDVGQGSGLGLSMVYGFAKQSGGHVTIDSQVGVGTTVKLILPRADATMTSGDTAASDHRPSGTGQRILLLEDDEDVRTLLQDMIAKLGYAVVPAGTAAEAEAILAEESIDLVLSDVILRGGVSGPQFAARIKDSRPDLRVLFMSGYPADELDGADSPGGGEVLLNKPFKVFELAQALATALR
ncbi:MAG: PAS domain S-box protein [Alphaproteobacteria bacterium]|nr:PAS domain S-box protein [Alphaproteobacteria bacterium]